MGLLALGSPLSAQEVSGVTTLRFSSERLDRGLQTSTGPQRHPIAGAVVGLSASLAVITVEVLRGGCEGDVCTGVDWGPGLIFVASSTAVGALIGALIRTGGESETPATNRAEALLLQNTLALRTGPTEHGWALALRIETR